MANIPEIIALSSTSVQLGATIIITSSGGQDVASTAIRWDYGTHTDTANLGNFIFAEDVFEPLETEEEFLNVVFTMTSTFIDGTTGTTTATCKVSIPTKYSPLIQVGNIITAPKINGHTRAPGTGQVSFYVTEEGSATYEVSITDVTCIAPVEFDLSDNLITVTLPSVTTASEYTLAFKISVTDSRGRSDTATISAARFGTVYCYDAPRINIVNIYRCDEDGNEKPNGRYAKITGSVDDLSTPYSGTCLINSATYNCSFVNKNFYVVVGEGELDLGVNYPFTISYVSTYMHTQSIQPMIENGTVSMQKVPISLIDNGRMMGVSVGDMCDEYDDVLEDTVFNLAAKTQMRASDGEETVVETAYNVVNNKNYVEQTLLGGLKFIALSQEEYNAIKYKDYNTVYIIY